MQDLPSSPREQTTSNHHLFVEVVVEFLDVDLAVRLGPLHVGVHTLTNFRLKI
jgi:hypothetical protein